MLNKYEDNKKTKRINNVLVLNVKLATGELTVWRKKHEAGRITDILTAFFVIVSARIKDVKGKVLTLSDIKPGSRVTIDYVRESSGRFVAFNIMVVTKHRKGGEGDG